MSNLFLLSERLLDNSGEMNSSTILSLSSLHPLIFSYGGHIIARHAPWQEATHIKH